MKKVVYVVFKEVVQDYETTQHDVAVFGHKEDAKKSFKAFTDDVTKHLDELDWVLDESNNDHSFEAYEDGYAAQNHAITWIKKKEIV